MCVYLNPCDSCSTHFLTVLFTNKVLGNFTCSIAKKAQYLENMQKSGNIEHETKDILAAAYDRYVLSGVPALWGEVE